MVMHHLRGKYLSCLSMMAFQAKPLLILVQVRCHSYPVAINKGSYLLSQLVNSDIRQMSAEAVECHILKLKASLP